MRNAFMCKIHIHIWKLSIQNFLEQHFGGQPSAFHQSWPLAWIAQFFLRWVYPIELDALTLWESWNFHEHSILRKRCIIMWKWKKTALLKMCSVFRAMEGLIMLMKPMKVKEHSVHMVQDWHYSDLLFTLMWSNFPCLIFSITQPCHAEKPSDWQ